ARGAGSPAPPPAAASWASPEGRCPPGVPGVMPGEFVSPGPLLSDSLSCSSLSSIRVISRQAPGRGGPLGALRSAQELVARASRVGVRHGGALSGARCLHYFCWHALPLCHPWPSLGGFRAAGIRACPRG